MVLKELNARTGSEARAPSLLGGLPSKLLGYFKVLYTRSIPRMLSQDFLKNKSILYIALLYGILYLCIYMNLTCMLFYCIRSGEKSLS
jgi:hypothetical protein